MYIGDIFVSEKTSSLVIISFIFTVLAAVFVGVRIFIRVALVRSFGVDDVFIALSTLGSLGFLIAAIEQIRYGLGEPLNPKMLSPFIQATTASVISYIVCHLSVKLSISCQYFRIFITPSARRLFLGFIIFHSVYGTLCLLLIIMACWPVEKYWDDSIPGNCLDNRTIRYAFAGINIINDILLLAAPMVYLKTVQMAKKEKLIIAGVFAAGGVACIVAVVRLYSLWAYSSVPVPERPVKGVDIAIWSDLECNISIMCACVPSLNPLVLRTFPGLVTSERRNIRNTDNPLGESLNCNNISESIRSQKTPRSNPGRKSMKFRPSPIEMEDIVRAGTNDCDSERNLVIQTQASYGQGTSVNGSSSILHTPKTSMDV